jgi:hypothetical protein
MLAPQDEEGCIPVDLEKQACALDFTPELRKRPSS